MGKRPRRSSRVAPHRDNLRDVGHRYADILGLDELLDYLEAVGKRAFRVAIPIPGFTGAVPAPCLPPGAAPRT